MSAKKLQVFVSSTFTDLQPERQAAVEAVLAAGHIPAGMELFAAGDEEQLIVIRRWIDQSDAFLLILGPRYGSIEPRTGKSYIQLEYEYAAELSKPLFAVVIAERHVDEHIRQRGVVVETDHSDQLREFRSLVESKMVKFWSDARDIKLAIYEALGDIAERRDVIGWVRANEVPQPGVMDELARLSAENAELRNRLAVVEPRNFNGLTFNQLYEALAGKALVTNAMQPDNSARLQDIARVFGDASPSLLHGFLYLSRVLKSEQRLGPENLPIAQSLHEYGVVYLPSPTVSGRAFGLTEAGLEFLVRLRTLRDLSDIDTLRL